ncbi:SGNH/GDSL hydrolase family protein [Chishuiella changwenlii]|uniref:SGNH/GDSL hydrolase family protein n=1 Tax=Chishuiella changwenlii TaxID=1434701 RepID=UPI002FD92C0E
MTNCLFFGDSITYGEYDGILGGYVDFLKRFCHTEYYTNNAEEVNCFNLGIGGETTFGLLNRFTTEIEARLSPDNNLVFLFYGANDLAIKDNQELVSLNDFEANLQLTVKKAKVYTDKVYLISIIPISKQIDGVIVPSGKFRSTEKIELFNQSIEKIAKEEKVNFLDVYTLFKEDKESLLSKDGVHPNEVGYKLIAEYIKPIVKEYL